ncbi:DUF502 domain-containing protein [Tepidimonas sp.]|uniref:DUF502 domain-containing protein n=1 Tax=Tepidimonas sp. TaxID=2002775 RepID=UPI003919A2D2
MKRLSQYFLRGLLAVLPIGITLYLLYALVVWSEQLALKLLRPLIGDFYVPGLGLLLAAVLVVLAGFLVSTQATARLLNWVELPFTNLPVVKSIYSSLKSFADYFAPHRREEMSQQVVILRPPGAEWEAVGLVTRHHLAGLPPGFQPGERVAVYLPMGYMIGGYTLFVPRTWITPIDMSVEEAMRSSLIAWMAVGSATRPDITTPAPTPTATESSPR